jgi:hypothetical protein
MHRLKYIIEKDLTDTDRQFSNVLLPPFHHDPSFLCLFLFAHSPFVFRNISGDLLPIVCIIVT